MVVVLVYDGDKVRFKIFGTAKNAEEECLYLATIAQIFGLNPEISYADARREDIVHDENGKMVLKDWGHEFWNFVSHKTC